MTLQHLWNTHQCVYMYLSYMYTQISARTFRITLHIHIRILLPQTNASASAHCLPNDRATGLAGSPDSSASSMCIDYPLKADLRPMGRGHLRLLFIAMLLPRCRRHAAPLPTYVSPNLPLPRLCPDRERAGTLCAVRHSYTTIHTAPSVLFLVSVYFLKDVSYY